MEESQKSKALTFLHHLLNFKTIYTFFINKVYEETEQLCKEYASTRGPGTQAVPERHLFFKNLGSLIKRISEKCQRENGLM